MLKAGDLRDRVELQTNVGTAGTDGAVTDNWITVATVAARVQPLRGEERALAQQVQASLSHEVTLRPITCTTEQRIKHLQRLIVTADATANTLTPDGPVYNTNRADDRVRVEVATGGTLPGGLAAGTDYYAVSATGQTLKLSATQGGTAIDLTDAGTGRVYLVVPRFYDIKAVLRVARDEMRLTVAEAGA